MTLDTRIAIKGDVDPEELYLFLRPLVRTPKKVEPIRKDGQIGNPLGVGADAILDIYYDKARFTHGDCETGWCCDECEGTCEDLGHLATHMDEIQRDPTENGWADIEVSLDTTYGYRGPNGENCGELHAAIIHHLGEWLTERGAEYQWQDESTGKWYRGAADLSVLCRQGMGNFNFLEQVVKPAIEAEYQPARVEWK